MPFSRSIAGCILLLGMIVPASCADDAAETADPVVRDSAGVRIVEYAGVPDTDPSLALAPEPLLRHGGRPGEYAFGLIGRGRLFSDGSAALSDDASSEIVLVTHDGDGHSVAARAGEGPGEVGYVLGMYTRGRDSLLVLDRRNSRLSLFVSGSLTRTGSLLDLMRNTTLWPEGVDAAEGFLVATNAYRSGFEEEWLQGHMARFDPETGAVDTVASYDYVPGDGNPSPGFGSVTVADGEFVYTRSDKPEVTWRGADGRARQIVRWQAEPEHLTEEHLHRYGESLLPRLRFANPDAPIARIEEMIQENVARRQADLGKPLALFRSPFGDAEGRVWLPSYDMAGPREGSPPYTVFSPDGEWLGEVDAPPGLRILDVAYGRVLGVVTDEMDVQSVVVYELVGS